MSANTPGLGLRYWEPMLIALAEAGLNVTLYANIVDYNPAKFRLLPVRSKFLRLPFSRNEKAPAVTIVSPSLIFELRRHRYDLIVTVEYNMSVFWAILAALGTSTRVAILQEHVRQDSGLMRQMRRFMTRHVSLVIGNTNAACLEVLNVLGVPQERVVQIPLIMAPPRSFLCRRPINLPAAPHRPLFLCVSRLVPLKNLALLLKASRLVHQKGYEFTVWIVGTGPQRDELIMQRNTLGLQGVVELIGPLPYESIGFAYQTCDVFVLPTHNDLRAMSVLEAMRFGKPILLSRGAGAAGDVVHHGDNGLIFDPEDPEELAENMCSLICQPELREHMGKRSAEIAELDDPARSAQLLANLIRHTACTS